MSLLLCAAAWADVTDEATRTRLAALKELCDQGLVSPEVCMEKQRDILGLPPRLSGAPARGSAPPLRGSTPRPKDSPGSTNLGKDMKESGPAAAPPEGKDGRPGGVRESSLGFRMQLPAGWVLVAPQDMRKGFALLAGQVADNPEAKRVWERLAENTEVYLKDGEQISVQARAGTVPQGAADGGKLCDTLAGSLPKLPGRRLTLYACGLTEVEGRPTLYVDHDAVVSGMRTVQFWLEKEPGKVLQFTLNCKDENLAARTKELRDIVASVRW